MTEDGRPVPEDVIGMSEPDARFAARLADEIQAILGVGIVIQDIVVGRAGPVEIRGTCLVDGRAQELFGSGESLLEASRDFMRAAAEIRLNAAWNRLIAPS